MKDEKAAAGDRWRAGFCWSVAGEGDRHGGEVAIQYRPVTAASETGYPRDIFGHRTEAFEDNPGVWAGADVWWGRVAGQRLELAGSTSWLDHTDAVGTMTMQTDQTGAETWDVTHYPWGQPWQQTGPHPTGGFYADLEFAINDPAIPSATREYNPWYYRWLTPDPGGRKVVKLDNPQTWNMYAYVGDNPTTLNDPSGMGPCKTKTAICTRAEADGQETIHKAAVIYGETSGLRSEVGKNAKVVRIRGANPHLHTARQNIADVSTRNSRVYVRKPSQEELKNPQVRKVWQESQSAAAASNGNLPGQFFFMIQRGVGPQRPPAAAGYGQGAPIRIYGPFINVGGGSVPAGNQTYIYIYNQ